MKKYYAQAFFAVAILVGAAFIACDDEDHTSAATTFEKMEMDFSYEVSPDLLEVADITFTYTNPAGETTSVEEPLAVTTWSQRFTTTTFPASFSVTVNVAMKSGLMLDKEQYVLTRTWSDEFKEYRSDGKVHWYDGPDSDSETLIVTRNPSDPEALAAEIQTALNLMNRTFRYAVTPDPDGSGYEVTDND